MKKIIIKIVPLFILLFMLLSACKKNNYITGGVNEDVYKYANTSTYDVLKTNPLFDTLVRLIDTAGIKNQINTSGTTFFAPTDYAILSYLGKRTQFVQARYNQYAKFGLDSLFYYLRNNVNGTKDSLLMYLINKPLSYPTLTDMGAFYPTGLAKDTVIVSYEYTRDPNLGYNSVVSSVPQVMYYTHLWYPYALSASNPAGSVPTTVGVHTLVKTSGIITQNGLINILDNSHILYFYSTKK